MRIKAQVIDVQHISTARGNRLYTVFRATDGSELGVWTSDSAIVPPQIGDQVFLRRDRQGSLHFDTHSSRY
ncbi:MAG: hypothetical protein AAFQ61_08560 [Cyanobacteria bacterium J06626_23]